MFWRKIKRRKSKRIKEPKQDKAPMLFKVGISVLFLTLLFGNVIIFAKSVTLSDSITELEVNTKEVQKENERLKKDLYTVQSLSNLEELADQLGFTEVADPVYLEKSDYAFVQ